MSDTPTVSDLLDERLPMAHTALRNVAKFVERDAERLPSWSRSVAISLAVADWLDANPEEVERFRGWQRARDEAAKMTDAERLARAHYFEIQRPYPSLSGNDFDGAADHVREQRIAAAQALIDAGVTVPASLGREGVDG